MRLKSRRVGWSGIPVFVRWAAWSAVLLGGTNAGWLANRNVAHGAEASAMAAALDSISIDDVKRHVTTLADDSFDGRQAGSRGGRAAGHYLAEQFQKLRLLGGGDPIREGQSRSYFQAFGAGNRNVLGYIEGSDAELKREFILLTAHYDHVGYGNRSNSNGPTGFIHNGADDNASGVAAILEAADAFRSLPASPKRSVMFVFWDGEEAGLLGSKHWIRNPTVPLSDVAAVINCDMVGRMRGERVMIYGGRTSYGWRRLFSEQNSAIGLLLDFNWLMKADSDHHPFFEAGIPVTMLHTGLHDDYHRPSDDVERINHDGLQRVSRLLFLASLELAEADERPTFRLASRSESPSTQPVVERPTPPLPSRLGLSWDREIEKEQGVVQLTKVVPGSPADAAGLEAGDRIMSYAGRPLVDVRQFRHDAWSTSGKVRLQVRRQGQADPVNLMLEPSGQPVRVGISWKVDDAEPNAVVILRVVPGSPAEYAGLRVLDRIYRIGGKTFESSEQFQELLGTLPSPMEVLIERQGRLRRMELKRSEIVTDLHED